MEIIDSPGTLRTGRSAFRQLAKSLFLPLLAATFIGLSFVALFIVDSGMTQFSLWVIDAEGGLQQQVDTVTFKAPLSVTPEGSEASPAPTACAGRGREVVMESTALDAGERLEAQLPAMGMVACGGLQFRSNVPRSDASGWAKAITGWPQFLVLLCGAGVLSYLLKTRGEAREGGTTRHRSVLNVGIGLTGAGAVLACAWLVALAFPEAVALSSTRSGEWAGAWLIPLLSSLLIPFLEESACRAWLIPIAGKVLGAGGALVLSSIVFATSHGTYDLPHLTFYAAAGVVFALVWLRTRSLLACVIAHGTCNGWVSLPFLLA